MRLLLFFLLLTFICCKSPKQQDQPLLPNDTDIAVMDSINVFRERDSLYSIAPLAILTGYDTSYPLPKLIAPVVDTHVTVRDEVVKKYSRSTYNKDSVPVTTEYIYKSRSYEVRVWQHNEKHTYGRIYINGKELKIGTDIDTSLSFGRFIFFNRTAFETGTFRIVKFGSKEYLHLVGNIEKCNGSSCLVTMYILYDPTIQKAMVCQQFNVPGMIMGYDRRTGSPAFVDMDQEIFNNRLECSTLSGKIYRFDRTGKIRKLLDPKGEQFFFNAYTKVDAPDSIFVIQSNIKNERL